MNSSLELNECYRERIHEIGAIQDEGYVIAVTNSDDDIFRVTSVSDNIGRATWMVEKIPENILGKNILDVFGPIISNSIVALVVRFQSIMTFSHDPTTHGRSFQLLPVLCKGSQIRLGESLICCSVVEGSDKDNFLLEFEEIHEDIFKCSTIPNNRILQSGDTISRIRSADSIESVTAAFIDSMMDIMPGYDRGMVYQFLDDESGNVIYENIRDPNFIKSSYLNLRFPAADIPPQVRHLYLKNGLRMICNVNGQDSKIISEDSSPVDLTMSVFRACSPNHLQYLHNMGVVAAFSIAIVVDDTLWGLYVLHSYSKPTKPTVEERIIFEMIGSITSMRIHSFIREKNSNQKINLNKLFLALPSMKNVNEFLSIYSKELLTILDSHAIVLYYEDGPRIIYGDTNIILTTEGYQKLCNMSKMSVLLPITTFREGLHGDGAGVLFYQNQHVNIAIIRRNKIYDVNWGGNADTVINPNINIRLQPRTSFAIYIEKARMESQSWSIIDCELAQSLIDQIIQYLHSEMLLTFRLSLDQSNAECLQVIQSSKENYEFFAHMSHELRTPFHGVISSLQILQSNDNMIDMNERKEIIDSALECGKIMLRTLDDILTIAKSRNHIEVTSSSFSLSKFFLSTKHMMLPMAEHRQIDLHSDIGVLKIHGKLLNRDDNNHNSSNNINYNSEFKKLIVIGDETRLGQICNNLTNNAIKFTPIDGRVNMKMSVVSTVQEFMEYWNEKRQVYDHEFLLQNEKTMNAFKPYSSTTMTTTTAITTTTTTTTTTITTSSASSSATGEAGEAAGAAAINDTSIIPSSSSSSSDILLIYEVEDTGCGIGGDDISTIFDAYKQVSSGTQKTYQGTGLGLHIVRLHIESMNGILGVASTINKGTLFLFAVPLGVGPSGTYSHSNSRFNSHSNSHSNSNANLYEHAANLSLMSNLPSFNSNSNFNFNTNFNFNLNSVMVSSNTTATNDNTTTANTTNTSTITTTTTSSISNNITNATDISRMSGKLDTSASIAENYNSSNRSNNNNNNTHNNNSSGSSSSSSSGSSTSRIQTVPQLSPPPRFNIQSIRKDSIFLIVDDSQINLRLAKRKIQLALGNDIVIQTAEDGFEAVAAYETLIHTNKHHLLLGIFMDYHMPKCSGLEAIKAIRIIEKNNTQLAPCEIIAFTADVSETSISELIQAGANEVMAKPTPAGQLENTCIRLASKLIVE